MNYETLQLEIKDNIASITLNRPKKLNALSMQSLIDLHASLKQVIASREVQALLITVTRARHGRKPARHPGSQERTCYRAHLLGEKLSAETAADWGLIWNCVDYDTLEHEARAIVNKLAVGPTATYSLIKRLMRDAKNNSLREQIVPENECQSLARKTEENAEARKAFAKKTQADP